MEALILYDGKVKLNYQDKGHRYLVSHQVGKQWTIEEPVVGVTTVTQIINKPSLMLWPMNEALKYLRSLGEIPMDEAMLREAAYAHKKKSQHGKDAGTVGHSLVETLLLGNKPEEPPEALLEAYTSIKTAFEAYQEDFKPELLHTELIVYSRTHNVAGKLDDISTIDGKITLTDYKTTNPSYYNPDGIYAENFAQMGLYSLMVEEMIGVEVEEMQIVNLPKDGSEYKIKSLTDMGLTKTDAQLYGLHCLSLYNLHSLFNSRVKGS